MKNSIAVSILLSTAILGSSHAQEQSTYIQIGALAANYSEPLASFRNGMAAVTFGRKFDQNLSVEAMAATAINEASGRWGNVSVTAKVSNAVGVYAKAQTTPSNGLSLYGKAGFTHGTVSASARVAGYSASSWSSATSPSYGLGAQYDFSPNSYVVFDYMSYYSKGSVTISGPSVSYGFRF